MAEAVPDSDYQVLPRGPGVAELTLPLVLALMDVAVRTQPLVNDFRNRERQPGGR